MYISTIRTESSLIKAIKASGVIIQVNVDTFLSLLDKVESPLVVIAKSSYLFSLTYQYMISYKNFIVFTDAKQPLKLPNKENLEIIEADSIFLP